MFPACYARSTLGGTHPARLLLDGCFLGGAFLPRMGFVGRGMYLVRVLPGRSQAGKRQ
jgi:hypothetical protein